MLSELIITYQEYCEFLEKNCDREDIGRKRVKKLKNNFECFIVWVYLGDKAFLGNY